MVRVQADECPKSPQEGWISGVVVVKHALFSEGDLCMLSPGMAALGTSRFMRFGRDPVGDALLKGGSEAVGVAGAVSINPVQAYVLV